MLWASKTAIDYDEVFALTVVIVILSVGLEALLKLLTDYGVATESTETEVSVSEDSSHHDQGDDALKCVVAEETTITIAHRLTTIKNADRIVVLGGSPACVTREIDLTGIEKSRDWLYEQSALRKDIFNILRHD